MTPTAPNFNLGALLSTTIADIGRTIGDNVTNSLLLFHWLTAKGMKKTRTGGAYIQEPVMLEKQTSGGPYRGYEEGVAVPQEGITSAIYPWRQYRKYVIISGIEKFQNGGVGEISDLLDQKMDHAILGFQDDINGDAYLDGSGSAYKAILGLDAIAPIAAATSDNLGLIDASVNTAWVPVTVDGDAYSTTASLRGGMRSLYNQCSRGRDHPTIGITTRELYENYEKALVAFERYNNVDVASGDFEGLMLKGCPIFFDEDFEPGNITSHNSGENALYLLNHKHLRWNVAAGVDFSPSPFYETAERDALVSCIKLYGNLSCKNRRFHGLLHDVADSLT